jgi:hypothetical protein
MRPELSAGRATITSRSAGTSAYRGTPLRITPYPRYMEKSQSHRFALMRLPPWNEINCAVADEAAPADNRELVGTQQPRWSTTRRRQART